jgi:hypothetical protein
MLDATQVLGQGLAARPALAVTCRCLGLFGLLRLALQHLQLRLQAGLVFGQRTSSNICRCWAFIASVLAPNFQAFKPRELERDALDLGVLELDGTVVFGKLPTRCVDLRILRYELAAHRCGQLGHCAGAQGLEVLCPERLHIEHAPIVGSAGSYGYRGIFALPNCPSALPSQAAALRLDITRA